MAAGPGGHRRPPHPRLWQVLDATSRGLTAKETARELGLAMTTAQDRIAQLNKRLGVSSRGELVRAGLALQRRRGPAVPVMSIADRSGQPCLATNDPAR